MRTYIGLRPKYLENPKEKVGLALASDCRYYPVRLTSLGGGGKKGDKMSSQKLLASGEVRWKLDQNLAWMYFVLAHNSSCLESDYSGRYGERFKRFDYRGLAGDVSPLCKYLSLREVLNAYERLWNERQKAQDPTHEYDNVWQDEVGLTDQVLDQQGHGSLKDDRLALQFYRQVPGILIEPGKHGLFGLGLPFCGEESQEMLEPELEAAASECGLVGTVMSYKAWVMKFTKGLVEEKLCRERGLLRQYLPTGCCLTDLKSSYGIKVHQDGKLSFIPRDEATEGPWAFGYTGLEPV